MQSNKEFKFEDKDNTKESYWKQRVDLLIYEKKKWIKEKQKYH